MTTPDRLYPSIPDATEGDLAVSLEECWSLLPDKVSSCIVRLAAHHARRAEEAEAKAERREAYIGELCSALGLLVDSVRIEVDDPELPMIRRLKVADELLAKRRNSNAG